MHSMTKDVKWKRGLAAVAAGTSDQTVTIDMAGFRGAVFLVMFGTLTSTAVTSVKLGAGDASNGSDAVDLDDTHDISVADDRSNDAVVIEAIDAMPEGKRYLTLTIDRGTANAVIDGVMVGQFHAKATPVTHDTATIVGTGLVSG